MNPDFLISPLLFQSRSIVIFLCIILNLTSNVMAEDVLKVQSLIIPEQKAVFATVESQDIVTARVRIGGTIKKLDADEGQLVKQGAKLAVVVNALIEPQIGAAKAQEAALEAQLEQAKIDLSRTEGLFKNKVASQAKLDANVTQVKVLEGQLAAAVQERAVLQQQLQDGDVLAPLDGRIINVPVIAGSVVMAGEIIATIASDKHILRLRLPERHARFIALNDEVRIDSAAMTDGVAAVGLIEKIYPNIEDGRVIADVAVQGLGQYFVGERVRVHISTREYSVIAIPEDYIKTRFGVDSVRLKTANNIIDLIIQRGSVVFHNDVELIEVLSGLTSNDELVKP
ncbi:MAG: efflux transporter periplasmic adaptor subunit [Hyphomicrobiales bacterium]|nr:MAG: efflux transporter periplasmic adaptor subunit [Hyphomicrobiales bacterium]